MRKYGNSIHYNHYNPLYSSWGNHQNCDCFQPSLITRGYEYNLKINYTKILASCIIPIINVSTFRAEQSKYQAVSGWFIRSHYLACDPNTLTDMCKGRFKTCP